MTQTKLWLIRHGMPVQAEGRCYGRTDLDLSAQGEHQAKRLVDRLENEPLVAIYASSLRRAIATASVIAVPHRLQVKTIDALCEINFGDCEGLPFEEIQARYPDLYESWMSAPTKVCFPNGEGYLDVKKRVLASLRSLRAQHRGQSFAIVSHSTTNRIILAEALSIPDSHVFAIAQRYGALNLVTYFDDTAIVELANG